MGQACAWAYEEEIYAFHKKILLKHTSFLYTEILEYGHK